MRNIPLIGASSSSILPPAQNLCANISYVIRAGKDALHVELLKMFGLMLNGHSDNSIHYIALFCVYIHHGEFKNTFLACVPLLKESVLSAQRHHEFICELLLGYENDLFLRLFLM